MQKRTILYILFLLFTIVGNSQTDSLLKEKRTRVGFGIAPNITYTSFKFDNSKIGEEKPLVRGDFYFTLSIKRKKIEWIFENGIRTSAFKEYGSANDGFDFYESRNLYSNTFFYLRAGVNFLVLKKQNIYTGIGVEPSLFLYQYSVEWSKKTRLVPPYNVVYDQTFVLKTYPLKPFFFGDVEFGKNMNILKQKTLTIALNFKYSSEIINEVKNHKLLVVGGGRNLFIGSIKIKITL